VILDSYSKIAKSSSRVSLSWRRKWLWPILAVAYRARISDFLLRSEYIGKTGIFQQVRTFVEDVKARVASGELKGLAGGGVVNSAANQTFFKRRKWRDVMYTVNCLAPALSMRGLLGVILDGEGSTVVNVGSGAYEIERCDYFEGKDECEGKEGEKMGFLEGMKRYGSCKLVREEFGKQGNISY